MSETINSYYSLIDGIYKVFLGRPADQRSLDAWSSTLSRDHSRIETLLAALLISDEFALKLGVFVDTYTKSPPLLLEHSQNKEISLLFASLLADQIKHQIVVDVGANGLYGSNSYDLIRYFSWRGLLVEANPRLIQRINDGFAGLSYTLISAAVSNYNGSSTLFVDNSDNLSTIRRAVAAEWGEVKEEIKVIVRRLPELLQENTIPTDFGLLSIDTEGEDLNILNDTIDSGYRPQWIIFEGAARINKTLGNLSVSETVTANYMTVGTAGPNFILKRVK